MEKKVMNARLAVVLLFGLLLSVQEAAAAGYNAAPATEAAPATDAATPTDAAEATPTKASDGYAPATDAAPTTDAAPATDAAEATPTKASDGYAPTTDAAPATDAAEATPATPSGDKARASYGKASKAECEVPGTCDVKLAAAASSRPGAEANTYTRGCSAITGCRG